MGWSISAEAISETVSDSITVVYVEYLDSVFMRLF